MISGSKHIDDLARKAMAGDLQPIIQHKPVRICIEGISQFGVALGKDNNGLSFVTLQFAHPNGTQYEIPLSVVDADKIGKAIDSAISKANDRSDDE